jgi:transcription factor E
MQVKLLKDIVTNLVGPSSAKIVDLLYNKKNVNEFLIAKILKLTINQTRNILYKLADDGLVSFIRKKDRKRGGWYTYFWTLNSGKSLIKFREKLEREVENLKQQLSIKKSQQFFGCKNCHIEYNNESALLNDYTCPECGEVLELKDSSDEIFNLEKQINKFAGIFEELNKDIGEIMEQENKIKGRRLRAEAKKKEKERAERKKERDKLKKKLEKEANAAKAARKAKRAKKKK